MRSASSVLRLYLVAGVAGWGVIAACASSPGADIDGSYDGGSAGGDAGSGTIGQDAPSASDDAGGPQKGTGSTDAGTVTSSDSGKTPPPVDSGSSDWVNMTNNASGCENKAGTPCGYTATNEGQGYICTCYDGNDSVPWGCEPEGSCVTPGPSCPASNAPICDAGVSSDAGQAVDAGSGGGDAGDWVNMNTSVCETVGTPCGWTATNEGQGYTCICYFPSRSGRARVRASGHWCPSVTAASVKPRSGVAARRRARYRRRAAAEGARAAAEGARAAAEGARAAAARRTRCG